MMKILFAPNKLELLGVGSCLRLRLLQRQELLTAESSQSSVLIEARCGQREETTRKRCTIDAVSAQNIGAVRSQELFEVTCQKPELLATENSESR
ncbi:hypothetical protein J6590_065617 [Homalodisca vitripennis]|nr:hypothetical protein J6590_096528 [Homalodisca vitripennis]KAG8296054.1 hypothetical protein J6590_065617 [Homalodisca vitripennis]